MIDRWPQKKNTIPYLFSRIPNHSKGVVSLKIKQPLDNFSTKTMKVSEKNIKLFSKSNSVILQRFLIVDHT